MPDSRRSPRALAHHPPTPFIERVTGAAPVWAAAALCLACAASLANDRPYLVIASAAAEEDDDNVWAVESWATQLGGLHSLSVAPEYAFNPTTSLQLELGAIRRRDSDESASFAELEFKHLFNHIARDGYGWGVVASLGRSRTALPRCGATNGA